MDEIAECSYCHAPMPTGDCERCPNGVVVAAHDHLWEKVRKHDRSGPRGRWVVVGRRCLRCGHQEARR